MQSSAGVVFESEQERAEARVRSRVVKSSASERARHGFEAGAESKGEHPDPMKKHRRLQSF